MNENDNQPLTETQMAAALNAAFDASKLTFHNRAEALAAFKADREIVVENGQLFALYDGCTQPLGDAFAKFGADNRGLIDGRSLPRTGVDAARPGPLSKADLKTVAEKVAFIAEHGSEAFEQLPLQPVHTGEVKTFEDWMKLPTAEKVRLTALDPHIVRKLRPSPSARQHGTFIKPGLAEDLARTNPGVRLPGWSRKALDKRG